MFLPPIPVHALVTSRNCPENWLGGSDKSWSSVSLRDEARVDRQLWICLTCSQARPLCASAGVKSVRGAQATGQELGISVGIRNELKERHLSACGQSEQLVLGLFWNGGGLVFPCRPWEGTNESLEEGQVS